MESSKPSLMTRQIGRVNRRLFVQVFLNRLAWCWASALGLTVLWFLLQPFLVEAAAPWLRWAVAGGLVALGTVIAVVLARWAAPSHVTAALELDDRFGLKERVTTSLMLTPEQLASPAGKALLDDVHQKVEKLDIPSRFPVKLNWPAALVPTIALVIALVAVFYEPSPSEARNNPRDELSQAPVNLKDIDQKMAQLKKKVRDKVKSEQPSEEVQRIEAELDKIANKPHDTREQLKQRIKEMQALEDEIKDKQKQSMDKQRSLKQQLQQMDQQTLKNKDGPAKDLEKALSDGDFNKAHNELDKLAEKMKNNELTEKEKDKLKDQLQDLQDKLERLARNKDKEEELKKLNREGKLDQETLERELKRLEQESEKLQDLQDLADRLGEAKKNLENGDNDGAMDQLKSAANKLKDLDLNDKDLQDLDQQLQRLRDAKEAANKGDGADKGDREGKDGKGKGEKGGDKGSGKGDTDQPNEGGIGEGKRPQGEDHDTKSFEARQKLDPNWKGKKIFDGFAPGQNYKSKSSAEIQGEVKQAAQEAPEAIEQQRIPKAARDIAKGYFKNLGGQDDRPPPAPKAPPK